MRKSFPAVSFTSAPYTNSTLCVQGVQTTLPGVHNDLNTISSHRKFDSFVVVLEKTGKSLLSSAVFQHSP